MWNIRNLVFLICLKILLVYAADTTETATQVATNNIPTCIENDQNVNDCLLKAVQELIPRSKYAIPELNITSMDPFYINRTSYIFSHPLFEGKLSVRNVKVHGLSTAKVKSLQYKRDGKHVSFNAEFSLPKLFIEGLYKAKVRFNAANISSRGPHNVTLTNVTGTLEGSADLYQQDGHSYLHFKRYSLDPTVGKMIIKADGLMPDPLLNEVVLEFINQSASSLYKTLLRETRAAWEPEFVKLANEHFSHIPVDAILKS